MDIEIFRQHCLRLPGVDEDLPFGSDTLVFKTFGKIFALAALDRHPLRVNLKCKPNLTIELREKFESVIPGYHMNKKHWNTIIFDGSIPISLIRQMTDHSYQCVIDKLPKQQKLEVQELLTNEKQNTLYRPEFEID